MRCFQTLITTTVLGVGLLLGACSDDDNTQTKGDGALDAGVKEAGGDGLVTDGSRKDGTGSDGATTVHVDPVLTSCNNAALTPPTTGTCTAKQGTGSAVLIQGTILAPGTVYQNGHLLISGGKIACVGCDCSKTTGYTDATRIECAKGVVSPGLINPHDHMGWTTVKPNAPPDTVRYDHRHEWRTGKNSKPKIPSGSSNTALQAIAWGEARMVLGGATSIMGANSGVTGLLRNLDGKTEGLVAKAVDDSTFPLGDSSGTWCKGTASCYTLPSASTVKAANAWVPHVSEGGSEEAHNEFLAVSGQLSGTTNLLAANTALIHSIGLTPRDIQKMAAVQAKAIWSPRSNICLYGYTAKVVLMHNLGVQIALGTDWTISGSMNMLRELACADYLNSKLYGGFFKDYELWQMATENGADACGFGKEIGRLKEGYFADVTIFDGSALKSGEWPHAAVVRANVGTVALVLRSGKVLHGDGDLVKALDSQWSTGCEALSEASGDCMKDKLTCLKRETTYTLSDLKTKVGANAYKLYSCTVPSDEPTCIPLRPNEYTCKSSKTTDMDCDGADDSTDNCSSFFNPAYKMDNAVQPDEEKDKVGDHCDLCPFDTTNTLPCKTGKPDPNDVDGDTIPNTTDNCPYTSNKDQKDTDLDKIGDACDPCPNYANPGNTACALTLAEIRDPSSKTRPSDGTKLKVVKLLVTHLPGSSSTTKGFYVREGTGAYQAIFVYTGQANPQKATSGTALKLGDEVTVEGSFKVFNNIDEIEKSTSIVITTAGTGTAPAPVELKTADLTAGTSAEKWESHYVKVKTVKVAVAPTTSDDAFYVTDESSNTCSGTTPTCTKVDDFYFDGGKADGKPDNNGSAFKVGDTCSSISGIVNGYKDLHSLEPGSTTELVCP